MTGAIIENSLDPNIFRSANWYRAATLSERAQSAPETGRLKAFDDSRGDRRLQQWRRQPPFQSATALARRLEKDRIDENALRRLLAEPAEALRDRSSAPPEWLLGLERVYGSYAARRVNPFQPMTDGFLAACEPFFQEGSDRLGKEALHLAGQHRAVPFDPREVRDLFLPALAHRLSFVSSRTLVLELHVARIRGGLEGATSQARFEDFVERLREPGYALAILEEYPVLARCLMAALDQWVRFSTGFLRRLAEDWKEIQATFCGGSNPGRLTRLDCALGDTHREGSSVAVAHFGSGRKIVYKPRSMGVDLHFQHLLDWIHRSGGPMQFRRLEILDRGDHGWMEFVESRSCRSAAAVGRFYERQGAFLALLYALRTADIHSENLIACGEHPLLVDLEGLFHPQHPGFPGGQPGAKAEPTVMEVGLLPVEIWGSGESRGVDISGLGHREGQLSPFEVPQWEETGQDTMHLESRRILIGRRKNRPSLRGRDMDPSDYREEITRGFTSMYEWIGSRKEELTSLKGPLSWFAGDEVRFIPRPTQVYAELLDTSYHPDALRDALDRDRHLDLLWTHVPQQPHLERLVALEQRDLIRGDVPIFTTRTDSRHLWSSSGEMLPDYFRETSLELSRKRLLQFGSADLARQLEVIRASLARTAA